MRDERGFSLVEVLAALVILTLVITSSLVAFLERNKRMQQASEIVLAYQALANEAEFRRHVDFANLKNETSFLSDTALLKPLEPYATKVVVTDERPGVRKVTLAIRWHEATREAKLVVMRVDTGGKNLW